MKKHIPVAVGGVLLERVFSQTRVYYRVAIPFTRKPLLAEALNPFYWI